jgi:hypothetical protein
VKAPFLAILVLVAATRVGAAQDLSPWTPPTQPLYVVAPNNTSEGSRPTDTKFGDLLVVQIYPGLPGSPPGSLNEDRDQAERKKLYEVGKVIPLYVDGERRGEVRTTVIIEHQCNSAAAVVVPTLSVVSKMIVGIATNSVGIRSRPGRRRTATQSERSSAMQLAIQEFRKNNVEPASISPIKNDELLVVELDDTRQKALVGSFFIQNKTERHDVFLIVRFGGSTPTVDYSDYSQTTDLDDLKDHVTITFVDHLDLNDDHSDEIVLSVHGYENEGYEILERQRGKWRVVATGGDAGC